MAINSDIKYAPHVWRYSYYNKIDGDVDVVSSGGGILLSCKRCGMVVNARSKKDFYRCYPLNKPIP